VRANAAKIEIELLKIQILTEAAITDWNMRSVNLGRHGLTRIYFFPAKISSSNFIAGFRSLVSGLSVSK